MENQPNSSSKGETPAAKPAIVRRRLVAMLLVAVVLTGVGSLLASRAANRWTADPTPLPRPWINAPFITTPMDVVDKMCEVAQVQEADLLYDLGCGDGRIAITAAEKYGCRSVGFDLDPDLIRTSRENAKNRGVEGRATFKQQDVFTLDFREVDVVAMYLLPRYMEKLKPQFAQLRPGARIVSHDFFIEGVPPDKTVRMESEDGREHTIYLWIAPLKTP